MNTNAAALIASLAANSSKCHDACGNRCKVIKAASETDSTLLTTAGAASCRLNDPDGTADTFDLSCYESTEELKHYILRSETHSITVERLLERLDNPFPFLHFLRSFLWSGKVCRIIGDCSQAGNQTFAPQPCCILRDKEGTIQLLKAAGFRVQVQEQAEEHSDVYCLELSADYAAYEALLSSWHFPPPSLEYLVVSQEHCAAATTGGIGTYVGELEKIISPEKLGIFLIGQGELLPSPALCQARKYISLSDFGLTCSDALPLQDAIAQSLDVLIFFYPSLKIIEVQDVNGKACQFLQAHLAGKYPDRIKVQVVCHASRISLEKLYNVWLNPAESEIAEEKFIIEHADFIKFPTRYLHNFYRQVGYAFQNERTRVERLPFSYSDNNIEGAAFQQADTLLFFGKRSHYKGFDVFTETVKTLVAQHTPLKRILLIGPRFEEMSECNQFFDSLSMGSGIAVEEYALTREQALSLIKAEAHRSICVMTYVADNHPYSLLEIIDAGCMFVASGTGGIPELIPEQYKSKVLSRHRPDQLASLTAHWINESGESRHGLISALRASACADQVVINQNILHNLWEMYKQTYPSAPAEKWVAPTIACLVVIEDETASAYLENLIASINRQTLPPDEVIFVAGPSAPWITAFLAKNKDMLLASVVSLVQVTELDDGAMLNATMLKVSSDFVVTLCPYAILYKECISSYAHYMIKNPQCDYVSSFLGLYDDYELPAVVTKKVETYLGDGMLTSQTQNTLGHAFGMYRISSIAALGGFEQELELSRNGWAMQMKMASSGYKLGVVPSVVIQFPLIRNDYTKRYKEQYALALATSRVSHFESFRLQGWMRHVKALEALAGERADLIQYIRSLENSLQATNTLCQNITFLTKRLLKEIVARCVDTLRFSALRTICSKAKGVIGKKT